MPQQRSFGRRQSADPAPQPRPRAVARPLPQAGEHALDQAPLDQVRVAAIMLEAHAGDDNVSRELDDWKDIRKAKKRSFREPWRTVSIVAGLGFAVGSLVLPDSVAAIGQWVSGGLALASFLAGWRRRP